jgi:hypothetical protein
MTAYPHDLPDLFLAPVVLALDSKIEELSKIDDHALAYWIALEGDRADWTPELRQSGLLQAIRQAVDLHDWQISVDPRGLKLSHGRHSLVIGIPQTFVAYLAGTPTTTP